MKRNLLFLFTLLVLTVGNAQAATYYVATTGSDNNSGAQNQPFRTVAKGIAAAANGDTVLVANGVYSGVGNWNLNFQGKNFTLRSQGGMANCSIQSGGIAVSGFNLDTGTLDGFTISNATGSSAIQLSGSATLMNCVISNNRLGVSSAAGGIAIGSGSPLIQNCAITGNSAERGGGIQISSASPTIVNSSFSSNTSSPNPSSPNACYGGAIDIIDPYQKGATTIITNCAFTQNEADGVGFTGSYGGALSLRGGSAAITNCAFNANVVTSGGGGVYTTGGGRVVLTGCAFSANHADSASVGDGGGFLLEGGASGTIVNCKFIGNHTVGRGGAILVSSQGCVLTVLNSTITGNTAPRIGGIYSYASLQNAIVMTNSIVYGDSGGELSGFDTSTVNYSDVGGGFAGTGNINADPLFAQPASGNYRLQPASPCINAGTAAIANLPATDIDGAPRNLGGAPDMGAYESTAGIWFVDIALGSDANPGSPSAPFRTVVKAVTVASNGHNIYIKAGNYGTDKPRITKALRLFNWLGAGQARLGKP